MAMRHLLTVCGLILVSCAVVSSVAVTEVFIGQISAPEDDSKLTSPEFWSSNESRILLYPNFKNMPWWGSRHITEAMCMFLGNGCHVIVSGAPYREYRILQSYSSHFHLPLISTRAPSRLLESSNLQLSMMPDSAKAVADLMQHYGWKSFIFFYDNDDAPYMLEKILDASDHRIELEALWRVSSGEEAQRYLQWLRPGGNNGSGGNAFLGDEGSKENVLLSTKEHLVDDFISTLSYGTGIQRSFHFIMTDPVGIVEEGSRYQAQGSFMITKLSLGNAKSASYLELEKRWQTLPTYFRGFSSISTKTVPTSALLLRDVAYVLTTATQNIPSDVPSLNMTPQRVDCLKEQPAYATSHAMALTNLMKKVAFPDGKSGNLHFTQSGERDEYSFELTETTPLLVRKIGTWSKRLGLRLTAKTKPQDPQGRPSKDKFFRDSKPKYIVTSILSSPYLDMNGTVETRGNDRFKGFIKDLMDAVCDNLDCEYEMRLVKDGMYGIMKQANSSQTSPKQLWTGMIGEVIREEVDLAAAPLTITNLRKEVVDFTKPFMLVGLNVLVKKPEDVLADSYIGAIGFLSVWSYKVWLLVLAAYLAFGGANFLASHFTGEPERIRSLNTKVTDRLSLSSSYWFTLGSFLFRDTGIYPRSETHRLLSILWWVFSLVCLAFYVSSVTSILILTRTKVQTTHSLTRSSDVLQSAMEKGYPTVGAIRGGSTNRFFLDSEIRLYKEFGKFLSKHPEVLMASHQQGIEKIRSSGGSYAMVTESTAAEFLSNTEPCDLVVTAGYLDQKSYGFAFKKGSALRETFDHALLELTEDGTLRNLYEKWWYHEKLTTCEDPNMDILPSVYSSVMTLEEVSGVFYLLMVGVLIAVCVGVLEHFRGSSKMDVDN